MWRSFVFFCQGRPVLTPPKIRAERQAICDACRFQVEEQCVLCSCFISMAVSLSSKQCPDEPPKWLRLGTKKAVNPDEEVTAVEPKD